MSGARERALAEADRLGSREYVTTTEWAVVALADELREADARREQLEQALAGLTRSASVKLRSPSGFQVDEQLHAAVLAGRQALQDVANARAALSGRGGEQTAGIPVVANERVPPGTAAVVGPDGIAGVITGIGRGGALAEGEEVAALNRVPIEATSAASDPVGNAPRVVGARLASSSASDPVDYEASWLMQDGPT